MTYKQIAKVSADVVTLADVKAYLRVSGTSEDAIIQMMIDSAVTAAEKYMSRDILTTTYENYRCSIYQDLALRRGGFQSVTSLEVLQSGSYVTMDPSEYVVSIGGAFGVLEEVNPLSYDDDPNTVKITFKTGFGDDNTFVPDDIKLAIMQHVAFMYSNRGDCSNVNKAVPDSSAAIYTSYRIVDIGGYNNECV